ncbi:hypothetical protein LJ737_18600 [Hymenobacter sp. 15J16-1T3B]|uniref:hypothetical protein n=1 Tax=Hymenobacter sp. 15J16-1T3B TaxID=2886941 RepID=UPI001D12CDEA|nr:hypothetical protein [Hymenobacter sp. 15J16-1T3B]MCC3159259.1 hypothetical protein [Hymenobacter sp. 15J16-1T3B]
MRNVTCLAGLLLAAAPAWAQQPAPTRYLMLVREVQPELPYGYYRSSLSVIGPDGSIKTEEFVVYRDVAPKKVINASITKALADSSTASYRRTRYTYNQVYLAEAKKLNELGAQGWVLVNTLQEAGTIRYLFRQEAKATN